MMATDTSQTPNLPLVPEDITADWLSEVLGKKVQSVKIDRVQKGTASKVFASIVLEDNVSSKVQHLCIKGGFDPKIIEQLPWIITMYQREVAFFNDFAPKLDHVILPKSWWAGHNDKQGIIIMDDLEAQGCTMGTPAKTWPVASVMAGVEQLAALHSKTWNFKPADHPGLTPLYDGFLLALMETYEVVVRGPDRPEIPEYMKSQSRVTAVLKKHYATRNPKFRCMLHGDAHTGNTYFEHGAPRFLDWQIIHLGSAFHDTSYFIAGALSIEDRRAHEWDILEHYLRTLEKLGVAPLSASDEDVRVEYKKSLLAGVGWIVCPYQMQAKESVYPMAQRYAAALDDHNVLELVEGLPEPAKD